MKSLKLFMAVGMVLSAFAAEPPTSGRSPAESEARRQAKRAEIAVRAGGYVRKTDGQKGRIVFANGQKLVPPEVVAQTADRIGEAVRMAVEVVPFRGGAIGKASTATFLKDVHANGVIYLVESLDDDALLVSPEGKWAKVNIQALAGTNAVLRTQKEMIRAFVILFGGGSSDLGHPLFGYMANLEQLDAAPYGFPRETLGRLEKYLSQVGVTPYYQTTYRRACHLGWAPPPTNDVQKAIWDKIKAEKERGPTKPITIPPPNAKK